MVTVINDGRYDEIVTGVGFVSSTGKRVQLVHADNFPQGQPPYTLVPGDSMMGVIPRSSLRREWRGDGLGPNDWRVRAHAPWTEMPRGGHFAAMGQPELLLEDVRSFLRGVR